MYVFYYFHPKCCLVNNTETVLWETLLPATGQYGAIFKEANCVITFIPQLVPNTLQSERGKLNQWHGSFCNDFDNIHSRSSRGILSAILQLFPNTSQMLALGTQRTQSNIFLNWIMHTAMPGHILWSSCLGDALEKSFWSLFYDDLCKFFFIESGQFHISMTIS